MIAGGLQVWWPSETMLGLVVVVIVVTEVRGGGAPLRKR